MTDSQKAAREIFDNIVHVGPDGGWSMLRPNGDIMDGYDEEALLERIRQIIDGHLC